MTSSSSLWKRFSQSSRRGLPIPGGGRDGRSFGPLSTTQQKCHHSMALLFFYFQKEKEEKGQGTALINV